MQSIGPLHKRKGDKGEKSNLAAEKILPNRMALVLSECHEEQNRGSADLDVKWLYGKT